MRENFNSLSKEFNEKQEKLINSLYTILEKEGVISTYDNEEETVEKNQKEYYKNTRLLLKNYRALIFALSYTGVEITEELNCKSLDELERVLAHYRELFIY